MVIDHVGILVKSIEKGILKWEKSFGYVQHTEVVTNTRQKVRVVFLKKEGSLPVKLFTPLDGITSPSQKEGLHHLCFKCNKIEDELDVLQGNGMRVLVAPQPGEAFDNENIAFVFANQGLNIELIDTDKRSNIIG